MKIHPFLVTTLLCTGLALAPHSQAAEPDYRHVVHDARGQVVRNTFSNCVHTDWASGNAECGATERQVAQINAYEPIASEDRTVYFNFNKTTLAPSEQRKLNALVSVMKPMENIRSVTVVGYADRIGKTDYNERLSQKRAQVVENYLHQYGYLNAVDAKTEWLGEAESITACSDKLARNPLILCLQKDRRVTVDIQYNN